MLFFFQAEDGIRDLTVTGVQTCALPIWPNYLFDELPQRLAQGPVQFRLYVQLANPGDQTKDGSMVWPDDRQRVELGTISLTAVAPKNDERSEERRVGKECRSRWSPYH